MGSVFCQGDLFVFVCLFVCCEVGVMKAMLTVLVTVLVAPITTPFPVSLFDTGHRRYVAVVANSHHFVAIVFCCGNKKL